MHVSMSIKSDSAENAGISRYVVTEQKNRYRLKEIFNLSINGDNFLLFKHTIAKSKNKFTKQYLNIHLKLPFFGK